VAYGPLLSALPLRQKVYIQVYQKDISRGQKWWEITKPKKRYLNSHEKL